MYKIIAVITLVAGLYAAPQSAEAVLYKGDTVAATFSLTEDYTNSDWTHEFGYVNRAMLKAGFGLKNTLLGWTDIFTEPNAAARDDRSVVSAQLKGFTDTVLNTVGGLAHLITFPITSVDVALPEGGVKF